MSRIIRTLLLFCGFGVLAAQKVGFVDSQALLERMPEYKAAEQEIERLTQQWQKEIEDLFARAEQLFQQYREQEPLMSPEIKRRKQERLRPKSAKPESSNANVSDQMETFSSSGKKK